MKTITVVNQTYQDLEKLKRPGETIPDVIVRLLDLYNAVNGVKPILEGQVAFAKWEGAHEKGNQT